MGKLNKLNVFPEICVGHVTHVRHAPRKHAFQYPTYFLKFSVDDVAQLESRWLSLNRFNLFSFYVQDHAESSVRDLGAWARDILSKEGISTANGQIILYTYPRVLGYVFNPVSFWLCYDQEEQVRAVLCEVNNTFHERHIYLLSHTDQRPIVENETMRCEKVFHVSPFFAVEGEYEFQFQWQLNECRFAIKHSKEGVNMLTTALVGEQSALNNQVLLRLFFKYWWMTFAVIVRIHLQALQLWAKGVTFHKKPLPPTQKVSR